MEADYCAYPFLKEESNLCDYEIATDRLTSLISVTRHFVRHIAQDDMQTLLEFVYHANGSIRGKCAIGEEELSVLKAMHAKYYIRMERFVLPDGCIGASHLHVLRAETKVVIRIMHKIEREGILIQQVLFDFMNLLSNTFFMMCLYENSKEGIMEKEFVSRSYV